MEVGDMLKELNLTSDEIDRLTKAFRENKFREMFCDYAQKIADPANRQKYEEEIKLLEQERGNSIEFIHPAPCRVIKTSADGEKKCFINICSNEKIAKPEMKNAVSEDGRRGQCWSLPYSLFPGRQNTDLKGNKYVIYDVIFHPDTLLMEAKNKSFSDMVNNTAVDEIQKTFKVILDKNNMRAIKTKYKGTPQPCVIRKPIPGYKAKATPEQPDHLSFLYSDVTMPSELNSSFQVHPQTAKEPTTPNYSVKYSSVIDLHGFGFSRDSASSPRPKEIVITIDLPLLKSVGDTSLEVKGKILLLESKHPAYKLQLPLAYPVDEDNGQAKFNKQCRQLIVTLPVQPPQEVFFCVDPGQREEERTDVEEKEWESKRREQGKEEVAEEFDMEKWESTVGKDVTKELVVNGEEQQKTGEQEKKCKEPEIKNKESEQQEREELPKHKAHEEIPQEKRNEHILTSDKHLSFTEEDREAKGTSTSESTSTEMTKIIQTDIRDVRVSEGGTKSTQMFVTDVTNVSNGRDLSVVTLKQKENDPGEGDLPAERVFQTPELDKMPPAATLREIDADGNEMVISDHSTSAGFIFQNKLIYELD